MIFYHSYNKDGEHYKTWITFRLYLVPTKCGAKHEENKNKNKIKKEFKINKSFFVYQFKFISLQLFYIKIK